MSTVEIDHAHALALAEHLNASRGEPTGETVTDEAHAALLAVVDLPEAEEQGYGPDYGQGEHLTPEERDTLAAELGLTIRIEPEVTT